MKTSTRPFLLLLIPVLALMIAACGGSGSAGGGTARVNGFVGNYSGSAITSSNTASSVTLSVAQDGTLSGSFTNASGTASTVTGSVSSSGATTLTVGSTTWTGTLALINNGGGPLTGTLTSGGGVGGTNRLTVTVTLPGHAFIYQGMYTGAITPSSGNNETVDNLTINGTGAITGLATSGGSINMAINGTISNVGVSAITLTNGPTVQTMTGIAAFNSSGQLVMETSGGSGAVSVFTLTPAVPG